LVIRPIGARGYKPRKLRRATPRRLALLALVFALGLNRDVSAEGTVVPPELQVELLSKLSSHDRSFATRAGDLARVLILIRAGSARSEGSATVIKAAFSRLDRFGGLPHVEAVAAYDSGAAVAKRCRNEHLALVYVTPGLDGEIERLRSSLTGVDVLTVGAEPDYVGAGIVLGCELLSGKPKMLINYEQAKQQNVNFAADVLRLMKVVSK
jgi:hypothetical protein